MRDDEKQALISSVIHGQRRAGELTEEEFIGLIDGLRRMYNARIWNCVDASGKWDTEWGAISDVFDRVYNAIAKEKSNG
ncbi:MAG: hypothetical protein J6V72_12725 [Kiritimatiellae bacterium]|nr:hypothetical protein [Kiritimatiellia bacterium]